MHDKQGIPCVLSSDSEKILIRKEDLKNFYMQLMKSAKTREI